MMSTTVGSVCMKEVNDMLRRPNSAMYHRAVSFKWLVGLILMLAALYAYVVNHVSLLEAATLFGIGVILA
jgi:cell division septal protein FtsQ